MNKISYIKKIPSGKYRVFSEKGKNLGTYDSKPEAEKRLQQIEYFKHKKASKNLDLSELDEFSYSSVLREVRKQLSEDLYLKFIKIYKDHFDKLYHDNNENLVEVSMCKTLLEFNKEIKVDLDSKLFKKYMLDEKVSKASNRYFDLIKSGFDKMTEKDFIKVKAELIDMDNSSIPVFMYINSDIKKFGNLKSNIIDSLLELG